MRKPLIGPGLVLLAWFLAAGPAAAAPADDLLARLKSDVPAERAQAARELGLRGAMPHTPALAALLRDKNPLVREAAHDSLWQIWMRSGDPEVDALMARGVAEMNQDRLDEAIATFSEIIRRKPDFSEGWNKRATALFMAKRYRESIADCRKVLALNPYHFGALFGLGLNQVGLDDFEAAVSAFERTLKVIPFSVPARRYIKALEKALAERQRKI